MVIKKYYYTHLKISEEAEEEVEKERLKQFSSSSVHWTLKCDLHTL